MSLLCRHLAVERQVHQRTLPVPKNVVVPQFLLLTVYTVLTLIWSTKGLHMRNAGICFLLLMVDMVRTLIETFADALVQRTVEAQGFQYIEKLHGGAGIPEDGGGY